MDTESGSIVYSIRQSKHEKSRHIAAARAGT